MQRKGVLRVIDANFNRAKEGLRVVEDIFRFILVDNLLRKEIRKQRHHLDEIAATDILQNSILLRNTKSDPGRAVDYLEIKRGDLFDLLYSNLQRVKESLRVLEEFFKLILPEKVKKAKKIRYEIYTLEKNIFRRWPPLPNSRYKSN